MRRRAMPKKLGRKLLQIRESLGMSQREIVKALNYKDTPLRASQISQYETPIVQAVPLTEHVPTVDEPVPVHRTLKS